MKGEENQDEEQECVCTPIKKEKPKEEDWTWQKTCPPDPRFQQVNQTKYCYYSFVDWHRCIRLLGDDYPGCDLFLHCWKVMCPMEWTDRWFDQMNNGIFPRRIYPHRDPPFEDPDYPREGPFARKKK